MNGKMDVTGSFEPAIRRTKCILFQPFDFTKWVCLGVIIFLETMFESGGRGGAGGGGGNGGAPNVADGVNYAKEWVVENLDFLLPVAVLALVLFIALAILVTWLRSHGTMMLIRAVALDDARIGVNWTETRETAFSLFLFRLGLAAIGFVLFIVFFAVLVSEVLREAALGTESPWPYLARVVPLLVPWICVGLVLWLVKTLLRNFVAPLMYRFELGCADGWRQFRAVSRGNGLRILGFLIIRFVYFIPFVVATILSVCCTCCIGFLPIVHHTLFAPFYVFDRAYSLCIIESLGPEYRMIQPPDTGAVDAGTQVADL